MAGTRFQFPYVSAHQTRWPWSAARLTAFQEGEMHRLVLKALHSSKLSAYALAVAGVLFIGSEAKALVLCVNPAGIVYALATCGPGQTLVNPLALGLQGPKGDTGSQGPAGAPGAQGPAGPAL